MPSDDFKCGYRDGYGRKAFHPASADHYTYCAYQIGYNEGMQDYVAGKMPLDLDAPRRRASATI